MGDFLLRATQVLDYLWAPIAKSKIIHLLREFGVISTQDADRLSALIETIFHAANPEEMENKIKEIYKDSAHQAGDSATAIISIAVDSVSYAKQHVVRFVKAHERVFEIVSSDVGGAINAAVVPDKFPKPFALAFYPCRSGRRFGANRILRDQIA